MMSMHHMTAFFLCLFLASCSPEPQAQKASLSAPQSTAGVSIATRFAAPPNFQRLPASTGSFAHYLRQLPLYPSGRKVKLYDGSDKGNQRAQAAVINMDVGQRDLQQCADAVMRLRAEYLWSQQAWDQIQFNFTNGFPANYLEWRKGKRIRVKGNQVSWINGGSPDTTYASFRKYLTQVFSYAGTHSLSKELKKVDFDKLEIGDIFIQGGFPGHAVVVVDKVVKKDSGDFAFLLAQSYMPAQDIHVLKNPRQKGAWYFSDQLDGELKTPEWNFKLSDLHRF